MGQGCLTEVKICGNFGKKSQTSAGHTHTSCDKIGDWTVVQLSGAMWRAHGHGPIKDASSAARRISSHFGMQLSLLIQPAMIMSIDLMLPE